jgi:hypothetical protein
MAAIVAMAWRAVHQPAPDETLLYVVRWQRSDGTVSLDDELTQAMDFGQATRLCQD